MGKKPPKLQRETRRKVFERDKVCIICGHPGDRTNRRTVHHKISRLDCMKMNPPQPELVNDLNNCDAVCQRCHRKIEREKKKHRAENF